MKTKYQPGLGDLKQTAGPSADHSFDLLVNSFALAKPGKKQQVKNIKRTGTTKQLNLSRTGKYADVIAANPKRQSFGPY